VIAVLSQLARCKLAVYEVVVVASVPFAPGLVTEVGLPAVS
jgi:hypothetical protein